jgi:hypothetical protein
LCTTFATTSTIILVALPRDAVVFFAVSNPDEVDDTAITTIQASLL